ncbi:MAG TPA: LptF/LptG family permease, partial [Ignavibacteria bacterium]|nr:LptF/LptG family permease [Ignavibacteria bacterium]HMQ99325.1 LptF/LptG family permease [Ignavibacteria bacterium]
MIKQIDRYIIIQFVKNFLFALLCFILIFILVDLFENLDKFIDNKLNFGGILNYYLYFIPEIIRLITPIAVLLATLFTAGRMVNYNETIAVKNAGISLVRFMMPFLVMGMIVTSVSLYFNNWVVPEANKKKFFIERNYLGKNKNVAGLNKLYFQDSKNQLVLIDQFKETELAALRVSIQQYNPDTLTQMIRRVDAEQMKWEDNKWILINAAERELTDSTEVLKSYGTIAAGDVPGLNKLNLVPSQITRRQLKPDEMNYGELEEFITSLKKGGQNTDRQMVDFYSKISFSFASLIIVVFGISISTGSKRRKGLALQFGISILVSFVYLGFIKISQSFGYNGDLDPLLTAWLANIAFAGFGMANLYFK